MRVIIIVLDSVGIGELQDARDYGDVGSNTLLNIKKKVPSMNLKNMINIGLSSIEGAADLNNGNQIKPIGSFCKLSELSKGKDTTVGHWEIAGIITEKSLPTYPNGFPKGIIDEFVQKTGRKVIGNCVASGTEIIKQLGDEHVKTGSLIVYTSADSVFQIAAHEEIIPIEELYSYCKIARKILSGENAVSRVIARPFIGKSGNYTRTTNREDFSLDPPKQTMLDFISKAGLEVAAVGKINDIFAGHGITKTVHINGNFDGIDKTLKFMESTGDGLIFTNLVDFDMLYGHRNDYFGYANALVEFDNRLPEIIEKLKADDILLITADHGCDPTTQSTDHSREYIPLLIYGDKVKKNNNLGIKTGFSCIGATVLDYLKVKGTVDGKSFLESILQK